MKYQITGVDATTGAEMKVAVETENITEAVKFAKEQGILASKIEPQIDPGASILEYQSLRSPSQIERVKYTYLINIFNALGWLFVIISIAICVVISVYVRAWIPLVIAFEGIIIGLIMMAISRILDYLEYSAQRLRDITELLNK